jgi:hypothetical protein
MDHTPFRASKGDDLFTETQANEHMKAFFLDLAVKGKNAWNAWRGNSINKGVSVTFSGMDFSKAWSDQVNFSEFHFGKPYGVRFSSAAI